MNNILPCKYPTTTLLLDDNQSFLESIKLLVCKPNKNLLLTTNPTQALQVINDSAKIKYLDFANEEDSGELKLDYSKIPDLAKNPDRADEVSVLVVDYYMPEIDGIEFCKKIKNSKCQKILLTANNNHGIAIQAFNQGLIQQYICKHERNVDELLLNAIKEAENRFLANKFSRIISSAKYGNTFFTNNKLQNFLMNYIEDNNIVEHYIFGENGDLFCIDKNGITSKIFIKTKEEIQIPLTWQETDYLPDDALLDIRACRKMLCFSMDQKTFPLVEHWCSYLIPTIQIPDEPYFISILKDHIL
jgi:CheY-like chemotaxis protein